MFIPRRDFLKFGARALSAVGAASVAGRLSQVNALAQSTCASDYKALVCVFLFGGNDGNNTLIPMTTPSNPNNSYANYASIRGGLALPQASLTASSFGTSAGDHFALHPSLIELANLYNTKKNVAVIANVGTLVTPLTRSTYQQKASAIPSNLFSHLDQQTEWQTSAAQGFATTGWGGRVADVMKGCNPSSFPVIVSVGGNSLFATGSQTTPATVTPGQTLGLQGFPAGAAATARMNALNNLLGFDNGLSLVRASNQIGSEGAQQANQLNDALSSGNAITTVFPNTSLGQQLAQVAKIINVRSHLGVSRQIFFTYLGGFDTHDKELVDQATGLQTVSQAMQAFYDATVEMGVSREVVAFTESDFGRTLQPSGGSTLGTDHAWGSHHLVVGDAVKGGDLYGTFPTQALNAGDDANNRGVWIPTTALEQYGATLATWFGVDAGSLGQVFPNLPNFKTRPAFL